MTGAKTIMRAFFPEREPHRPASLANFVEHLPPASQQLVNVNLMAHIPNEPIFGSREDFVQCDGQLDHPEVGAEVAAGLAEGGDQFIADFLGQRRQLLQR